MNYLVENNVKVVPNPIYSPDIAPSDFYLFGTLKRELKDANSRVQMILKIL
ncbi:mar1 putative transposase, putative [Trichomonas vaginalis G3]|uniref:Mar1 putative transposase, putative n=1 Tax=Trichomonas vaginalis (strain ATCC PRA-98 / G3) TaxID=412133 RepID=A2GEC3_TRIV3|nr:mar1 putative transposase, putative [Trichomonas vaginalis G3]|eukprot:XP_001297422.1 mar1 transposase [Trichomonas vaginalis G3]